MQARGWREHALSHKKLAGQISSPPAVSQPLYITASLTARNSFSISPQIELFVPERSFTNGQVSGGDFPGTSWTAETSRLLPYFFSVELEAFFSDGGESSTGLNDL